MPRCYGVDLEPVLQSGNDFRDCLVRRDDQMKSAGDEIESWD